MTINWKNLSVKLRTIEICSKCNKNTTRLHVHHVDGNKHNNKINNLQVLCINCHRKIHHPINIGSGYYATRIFLTKAQKRELDKIADITNRTITDLIREAANVVINNYRLGANDGNI